MHVTWHVTGRLHFPIGTADYIVQTHVLYLYTVQYPDNGVLKEHYREPCKDSNYRSLNSYLPLWLVGLKHLTRRI
jgi:hypothetical protein